MTGFALHLAPRPAAASASPFDVVSGSSDPWNDPVDLPTASARRCRPISSASARPLERRIRGRGSSGGGGGGGGTSGW